MFSLRNCRPALRQLVRANASVPSEADVVIIGGGAQGTSTLYHLQKRNVNAVLVEKDDLTAGTTWHSAGLHWRLRPNDTDIQLLNTTRELCKTDGILHKETDIDVWTANGGLFCANNEARLDEYRRLHTIGKVYGIESHILKPHECQDIYPLMNSDDMVGALYSPGDGLIDPTGITQAFAKAGRALGGKIFTNTAVTGITVKDGEVTGVETDQGTIKTKTVVNCGGCWGEKIAAMAGCQAPLASMRHAYVVTDKIPDLGFVPNIRDHDLSVYLKFQGQSLAIGGYEPNPIFWDVEDNFSFGLFDLDWDVFGFNLEGHLKRVPAIENVGIAHTVCGPESFTPDHKPLLGPAPEVRGFYFNCGYNSSGIMLSGGCGEQVAHWIVDGSPTLDMFGMDINRFHSSYAGNKKWCNDRSQEAYAKNYAIVFPHDQPLAGRNMRHTPFHERLLADGCVHEEKLGWERPLYFVGAGPGSTSPKDYDYYGAYEHTSEHTEHRYADLLKHEYSFQWPQETFKFARMQHEAARDSVAVFDMSAFGKLMIRGADAQRAMDWLCTNNVAKGPGFTTYTEMCNSSGHIEADLTVTCVGENEFYVVLPGASFQHDRVWIERCCHKEKFDVEFEDVSEKLGVLSVQGPRSREVLQSLTDTSLAESDFAFATTRMAKLGGVDLRLVRLTFVGELGWELHIPSEDCVSVYDQIMEAGRPHGICNAAYTAIESLSLEKGYKHWHADVSTGDTPLEAGLGFICKMKSSTPFQGREALEKQKREGLKKRLVYLYPEEDVPIFGLEAIYRNDVPVGFLRRGCYSFSLEAPLGTGYISDPDGAVIDAAYLKQGEYSLDVMGKRYKCRVATGTPFDPKNLRIKGQY